MNKQKGYIEIEFLIMWGMILFVLAVLAYGWWQPRYYCAVQGDGMGLRSDYSWFVGCRVEVAGRLVPIDMIRITQTGEVIIAPDTEG